VSDGIFRDVAAQTRGGSLPIESDSQTSPYLFGGSLGMPLPNAGLGEGTYGHRERGRLSKPEGGRHRAEKAMVPGYLIWRRVLFHMGRITSSVVAGEY